VSVSLETWLTGAIFYIGFDRYGYFGSSFVAAADYSADYLHENTQASIDGLEEDDITAAEAADVLQKTSAIDGFYLAAGERPDIAMGNLVDKMRTAKANL